MITTGQSPLALPIFFLAAVILVFLVFYRNFLKEDLFLDITDSEAWIGITNDFPGENNPLTSYLKFSKRGDFAILLFFSQQWSGSFFPISYRIKPISKKLLEVQANPLKFQIAEENFGIFSGVWNFSENSYKGMLSISDGNNVTINFVRENHMQAKPSVIKEIAINDNTLGDLLTFRTRLKVLKKDLRRYQLAHSALKSFFKDMKHFENGQRKDGKFSFSSGEQIAKILKSIELYKKIDFRGKAADLERRSATLENLMFLNSWHESSSVVDPSISIELSNLEDQYLQAKKKVALMYEIKEAKNRLASLKKRM